MPSPEPRAQRHLLHVFSTFGVGGPQVRFATIANHFGRKYRHTIIAMDGDFGCADRLDGALDLSVMPLDVRKGAGLSLANLKAFRSILRQAEPDLLLTYNWGTVEWALANRFRSICRNVHFEDGFGPEEARGQLARRVWMRRLALTGRTDIVVPSRTLERIARAQWHFSASRLHYVPNGVDCGRFDGADGAASIDLPPNALVIGSVGALRPEKNFALLVRAAAPLRDVHLFLIGDGPERAALEALATSLGMSKRVHFTGRVEQPETLLRRLDVYALSSNTEQMPISLIEAMAAGRAVAATDVGDVREMLAPANRPFVVARGNEPALTAALASLLADAGLRRRLGEENSARACAEFDQARMFASYAGLLDR